MRPSTFLAMIVICIISLLRMDSAHALYFTIQLKNGNEMTTEKYWHDGDMVRFYTQNGSVALPKSSIKNIVKNDGDIGSESVYFSADFLSGIADEEQAAEIDEQAAEANDREKEKLLADLQDRINVIETNLINLEKNKQTYMRQRETYYEDKKRSEKRIETLRQDKYTDESNLQERIDLEKSKIEDSERKIKESDELIKNTAEMIDNQKRMKKRLEDEMKRVKE